VQRVGERVFYFSTPPQAQLARLEWRDLAHKDAPAQVLVDPAAVQIAGSHASVNSFAVDSTGRKVAYNLSGGGSEITTIHVIDADTRRELPDVVENVWGEFAASWLPDASGFFYVQMAEVAAGADPMLGMRVKLHRLGQPVGSDPVVLGGTSAPSFSLEPKEFPIVYVAPGSKWAVATASGARTTERVAVARLDSLDLSGAAQTKWQPVAGYDDGVESYEVHGERLYLLSDAGAPNRRVLSVPFAKPTLAGATVLVPEDAHAVLTGFAAAADGLYLHELVDGASRVRRKPWSGPASVLPLPFVGSAGLAADPLRPGALLRLDGWTHVPELFYWDPKRAALASTGLAVVSPADTSHLVSEEVEVTSADGTRVPLSIRRRDDVPLDGARTTILSGYGGYGSSSTPHFSATVTVWLEHGGVFATCHVRGGGEKGERWHVDGMGAKKMNGIRDFIACAQYLVDKHYTAPAHLAAEGGSMGGVLVGRAITERPDLFAAAHISVGMVNPLRILQAENGANQLAELGSPETPEGARALLEMDPYQHVKPGVAYPAVLFTVGLNDRRVAPWMTGKMAARLQASTTSGRPVLVRTDADSGHGVGSTRDQAYAEVADVWSFLLAISGDPAFAPK
jgi:prolyl oligopeptidase